MIYEKMMTWIPQQIASVAWGRLYAIIVASVYLSPWLEWLEPEKGHDQPVRIGPVSSYGNSIGCPKIVFLFFSWNPWKNETLIKGIFMNHFQ